MESYAPYTPGIRHGQHFWLSGQIAIDGDLDIKSQTEGALAKIGALLEAEPFQEQYLLCTSPSRFHRGLWNDERSLWGMGRRHGYASARAAFEAGGLPKGALVEIVVQGVTS